MLTQGAFNALLKTLEEPPAHAVFILATTEVHKVIPTIISRCQRFDFKGVSVKDISDRIRFICEKENVKIDEDAITLIAENADGGMRDALSLLDEAISYSGDKVSSKDVYEVSGNVDYDNLMGFAENIYNKDSSKVLEILDKVIEAGKEVPRVVSDLIGLYRDMLLYKNSDKEKKSIFKKQDFAALATRISNERIYFYLNVLNEASNNMRYTNHKRTFLELALIKMSDYEQQYRIDNFEEIEMLKQKISKLEKEMKNPLVVENKPEEVKEEVVIKRDDNKEYVTVKMIEEIINNPDVEMRKYYQELMLNLNSNDPIVKQFKGGNLVVCGGNKAIITFANTPRCDAVMRFKAKEKILALLNENNNYLNDYYAIPLDAWNRITLDFKKKRKNGGRVILEPFNIDVIYYKDEEQKDDLEAVANLLFGNMEREE